MNSTVPRALALLQRQGHRFEVWHQAGERGIEEARAEYSRRASTARVEAFIDDMAGAYAWADLVICRAGALTVSELAAAGVGAILVPFPAAVDDHQTHNARYLTEAGAAALITDRRIHARAVAARALCARGRIACSSSKWRGARARAPCRTPRNR